MLAATEKLAECSRCGCFYSYKPILFQGAEVFNTGLCPKCEDADRTERLAEREQGEKRARAAKWSMSDLPFKDTDEALLPHPRSKVVLKWEYGKFGPFLFGPSGRGKTRTALLLAKRLWLDNAIAFEFVNWAVWQAALDKAHRYNGHGMKEEITRLYKWPFLVLDDVGKGKPSVHAVTALFQVIDYRTSRGLPTAITTKYELRESEGSPFEVKLAEGSADSARDVCRRLTEFSVNNPFTDEQAIKEQQRT